MFTTENIPGTHNINDPRQIFRMNFPEKSCIFIDEVSLIWDNRDFKSMDKRVIEWFRYQRHHKCRVYFFSQTFDIDKKLRDLADDMFLVNKYFRVFVVAKHIVRKPVVVHPGPDSPARIDDDMVVDGPLLWLFGGRITAFIPHWSKFFDSHKLPEDSQQTIKIRTSYACSFFYRTTRPQPCESPKNRVATSYAIFVIL